MVWASIKTTAFVGLAVATGVVCTSVPIAGKTISARLSEVASTAARKAPASISPAHPKGESGEAQPGVAAVVRAGHIDPKSVATAMPDEPAGDHLRDSERKAIAQLIEQRAHPAKASAHP